MGGGPESHCVGGVYGEDGVARHHPHRITVSDQNRDINGYNMVQPYRGVLSEKVRTTHTADCIQQQGSKTTKLGSPT